MKIETFFEGSRSLLTAALFALAVGGLQACGGDVSLGDAPPDNGVGNGDGPGNGDGNGGENGDGDTVSVETLKLLSSSPRLASSASEQEDGVVLTVLAKDADNNAVSGANISFSSEPDGLIIATDKVTADNGSASAVLTTGGDQRNRIITVRASAGNAEDSLEIRVAGTELDVDGPSAIRQGGIERFNISLTDDAGTGIFGEAIEVTSDNGNTVSPSMPVTDDRGAASVDVEATMPDEDTLTFAGFGLATTTSFVVSPFQIEFLTPEEDLEQALGEPLDITVELTETGNPVAGEDMAFFATRGSLSATSVQTDGDGRATVTLNSQSSDGAGPVVLTVVGPESIARSQQFDFISTNPTAINVQADPSVLEANEESVIFAQVTDPDGNPVKNQAVRFKLEDTSSGKLLNGFAVTDRQGIARVTYRAGEVGSGTESVKVTASVGADPVIASDSISLTVRQAALFISLASDNLVMKNDDATYTKTFNAIVTDANGSAPPEGTDVDISIRSLEFQKGRMVFNGTIWVPVYEVMDSDPFFGTPNPVDDQDSAQLGPYFGEGPFGCRSEDPFGTGDQNQADDPSLPGDYNGNGVIDPPNVAVVPASVKVGENGVAEFPVTWGQSFSQWILVRLTATVSAQGTEGRRRLDFVLPVAADDIDDEAASPPNQVSPFGTSPDCADPA